jgi:hypothetical protein
MKPIIYNASYLLNEDLMDFDIPVEIHVTRFLKNNYPQYFLKNYFNNKKKLLSDCFYESTKDSFKVFIDSNEPSVCYMKEIEEDILNFSNYYNLILTTNPNVLKNIKHSKLFLYGTTWLNKKNNDKTYLGEVSENFCGFNLPKENNISFLKTNKSVNAINTVPGYKLREKIWIKRNEFIKEVKFYYSNVGDNTSYLKHDGPLPDDDKLNLFKSKFSIIIENSEETNYFSEKLIDCLLGKTIPIYWGCPNIHDYFNCDGFLLFKNEEDITTKINNLNLNEFYDKNIELIESNFEIAKRYALNYSKRVEKKIKECLNDD